PQSPRTNIKSGLEFLLKGLKRRAIVFLVSDFDDANFSKPLRVLNKKHDVIAISLADRRDKILPQIGLLNLKDAETGAEVWVDTTDKAFLERYAETVEQQRQNLRSMARGMKLDLIEIDTAASYVDPLVEFFKMREKRYR
ncbi:MAG: DUF58 domain-containing protein, partial [Candidatus Marinimicrobia bacterium]|nr:DUF58 domain-containing protein [Candidatus Neomarinimicrobiota bacterium]